MLVVSSYKLKLKRVSLSIKKGYKGSKLAPTKF